MGLKRRRDDEDFMITLDQIQQMVEVMAGTVKRLREQAEVRLAADREKDETDTSIASNESSLVH